MVELSLDEAQLFNVLCAFFGRENVVPHMRVIAICGGVLPPLTAPGIPSEVAEQRTLEFEDWARTNRGLFTIVDRDDNPRMVIEFFSGFAEHIDVQEETHQRCLRPILAAAGIPYVTISRDEFSMLTDPEQPLDFYHLLKAKVEEFGIAE